MHRSDQAAFGISKVYVVGRRTRSYGLEIYVVLTKP